MTRLFILFLVPLVLSHSLHKTDDGETVFAQVLFRHGERTPTRPYHNDPYANASYWPEGWGQLMNIGKHTQYLLGQWLRERYSHLLGERYSPSVIYVMSTDIDRCLMSAQCNLAGIYPPGAHEVWGPIKWQPIPVHTAPAKMDKTLAMRAPCPVYDSLYSKAKKSKQVRSVIEEYKDVFDYVGKHMGVKVNSLNEIEHLYTTLTIQKLRNLTAPEWTKKVYPEPARTIAGIGFKTRTLTDQMKRLYSGPLLKVMIELFENKTKGSNGRKVHLFSAHDTTLAAFLNTLGIFDSLPPPFCAAVLLELKERNGEYFVQISYKNSTGDPRLLEIPQCGTECRLHDFKKAYHHYLPDNWDEECNGNHVKTSQVSRHHQTDDETSSFPLAEGAFLEPYNEIRVFQII